MRRVWHVPLPAAASPARREAITAALLARLRARLPAGDGAAPAPLLVVHRADWHLAQGLDGAVAAVARAAGGGVVAADLAPAVDPAVCGGCGLCVTFCEQGAVAHDGRVARVDPDRCRACGDCATECYLRALRFPDASGAELRRRLSAAAAAAAGRLAGRLGIVLMVGDPADAPAGREAPRSRHRRPALPPLGLLAGHDPAAVDAALADLLRREGWRRPAARVPGAAPPAPWPDDPGGWEIVTLPPETFPG